MNYITFNDVSAGDSIVVQFGEKEERKIGLIDFGVRYPKRTGIFDGARRVNPSKQFLEDHEVKEIEFLVISHPHSDHYEGLAEVLEYCEAENIKIKLLVNPFYPLPQSYFLYNKSLGKIISAFRNSVYINKIIPGANGRHNNSELGELLALIDRVCEQKLVELRNSIPINWEIKISDDISFKVLSPNYQEFQRFQRKTTGFWSLFGLLKRYDSGDLINSLSIVQIIRIKDSVILLTADAPISVLKRVLEEQKEVISNSQFLLIQIPHHGSGAAAYFEAQAWSDIVNQSTKMAIVSNGIHGGYTHPHVNVIRHIDGCQFAVFSTNHVFGILDVFGESHTANTKGVQKFKFDGASIAKS
ncbi:ComEC/Rec2 family competence protein [Dawidia soli]|uniref:Metallo-beta-lactamase domain-containing protein n=1 Tax=Dawidia soli TaxID=2782352 RepID=A0AAP2GFT8_9BACT|nr:hypothetical protein [Dawidia soli]MBT1689872.1 hypothetical protein [Dawidia soli]